MPCPVSSLPEVIRSCLVARGDFWFDWLITSTVVLFIGAIVEYWLEHEHKSPFVWLRTNPRGLRFKSHIRGSRRFVKFERRCKSLAMALVVLGIGGEGVFEVLSSRSETALRDFDQRHNIATQREESDRLDASKRDLDNARTALEGEIGRTSKSAKDARTVADGVKQEATTLSTDLVSARKQEIDLESRAAELKGQLVNLAVCNAPRVLSYWQSGDKSSFDPLLKFSGQVVAIEFVDDNEAKRAALNIAGILKLAKWDVQSVRLAGGLQDGVAIHTRVPDSGAEHMATTKVRESATALTDFLHAYHWEAIMDFAKDAHGKASWEDGIIAREAVRVQVGLYPASVYVAPDGDENNPIKVTMKRAKEQEETTLAQIEEQIRKGEANLPPEIRKRNQESRARAIATARQERARENICKPLDGIPLP